MSGLREGFPFKLAARSYALLYVVFLYLPVIFLPIFSVNTAATPKFPLSGLHLKWYEELPHTPALLDAAWNSLIVGVSASILATILRHLRRARHHPLPLSRPPRRSTA